MRNLMFLTPAKGIPCEKTLSKNKCYKYHYLSLFTYILTIIFLIISSGCEKERIDKIMNIPDQFSTIQGGIDAANNGDTILVQPGLYRENINFNGKQIVVGSLFLTTGDTSYIPQTIIDGDKKGTVVKFRNNEDSLTVLIGFTIQNGFAQFGGGIICFDASPTLLNIVIIGI